jgi:hypothetical protein
VPLPGPNPALPTDGLNSQINSYMYVRTLPADDNLAQMSPSWANVYANVLANWNAMAPCMDNWLDLADETRVRAYGPLIKSLTTPAAFENYRYMPVTRDLTAGARTLLYNFLDNVRPVAVEAKGLVAATPRRRAKKEDAKPALTGHAAMSRAMRGD